VGGVRKRVVLAIFGLFHYDVITSTKGQNFGSKFGCILGCNMKLRGLDRLPSVSGAQIGAKRPQIVEDMAE